MHRRLFQNALGSKGGAGCLLIRVEFRVFCDSHHGEDLLEVRGEAKGLDRLAAFVCRDHHLDHEGDAAGVEVFDLGEVEEDAFRAFRQTLVGAEHRGLRGARDVPESEER